MNTKQTEIGEIPKDWEVVKLGEIAEIDSENLPSDTPPNYEFDYISLEMVDNGTLLGTQSICFRSAPSRARRVLRENDVLLSTVRPNLKSHYLVEHEANNLICSTGFSVIRARHGISNPGYLFQHLFADILNNQIELLVSGSNYPAINSKDVKNLAIPLPPILEQAAIATILSDTDRLLAALRALIGKKRAVKTAAMQQLLSGRLRLPGFAATDRLKNSELGEIPEDWEIDAIGNRCETYSGGTPTTSIKGYYGGEIKWIVSSDLNQGFISNVSGRITELGFQNSASRMIKGNTLLLALYGATSGTVAISKITAAINQAILAIVPERDSSLFLYYWFNFNKHQIIESYVQGGQPNLSGAIIRNLKVVFPPFPEQTAIAQTLSDMDSEIAALEARAAKLAQIKQGLMQNLLTGKIRVNTGAA